MKGERITKECSHCGKQYETYFKHSVYCSKKCSQRALYYRWYNKENQIAKCHVCGKEFEVKKGYRRVCSVQCKRMSQSVKKPRKKVAYTECKFCGTEFLGYGECCSNICQELQDKIDKEQEKMLLPKSSSMTEFLQKIPKGMSYGTYVGMLEMGKETMK